MPKKQNQGFNFSEFVKNHRSEAINKTNLRKKQKKAGGDERKRNKKRE